MMPQHLTLRLSPHLINTSEILEKRLKEKRQVDKSDI